MAHTASIAIIGTDFAGLGMAARLKRAGFHDLTLFEKADDVGGCWRDNTYPGAACDVPSHLYSYSFAQNTAWSRRFAPQAEIHQYLRDTADTFGITPHIRFNSPVTTAEFDEESATWAITLEDGSVHVADILIAATGLLNRPLVPGIPGLDTFQGEQFHSATWNHDYDLTGKSVAVVGTGASAVQFVPAIAPRVARLTLFQKNAAHVIPKPDHPYAPIARTAFRRIPGLQRLSRWLTYWQLEPRGAAFTRFPRLLKIADRQFRRHIARQVTDDALRTALTPEDPIGCKRILLSNEYYGALTRDNVDVVTSAITEVTPTGVRTSDGSHHEVDAIIYGTGFKATEILGHSSVVLMLEAQINYVLQAVRRLAKGDIAWLEVWSAVQAGSNAALQRRIRTSVWAQECDSWYRTAAGKNTIQWPGFTFEYAARTRRLDESDFHLEPVGARGLPLRRNDPRRNDERETERIPRPADRGDRWPR
ncbi:NAD(P)/FAD-dependent oxidoreductase [Streptomyces prunicolor]|uniref:flavin-containing monooxygenase n=1 Tax=Streptomyces prunicolor TaxID=67348 RepID=UPI00224FC32D|nr:NAD(P)/FAD-dependent oxidoreductase [Streptomyces prunicolor]MCX5236892.1 NAD(P)/FAD-dependent oxidoreductase [Streptomyces prunicolor]